MGVQLSMFMSSSILHNSLYFESLSKNPICVVGIEALVGFAVIQSLSPMKSCCSSNE